MKKIVAFLLAAILLITVFAGCSGEQKTEESLPSPVAFKVGEMEFTVEDMNYMYMTSFNDVYNTFYNYYGEYFSSLLDISKPLEEQMLDENRSWHQYIIEITMDSTKAVAGIYQTAMENGFVLPEEYQKDIDTFDEQLASIAEEVGMTKEEYLYYSYGENVSIEAVKKMTEIQIVSNAYMEAYREGIEVSEEDIEAYYSANKKDIDTVDFQFYTNYYGAAEGEEPVLTKEEAEAQANSLAAAESKEEFISLAKEFTTDEKQKLAFEEGEPTLFSGASYTSTGIEEVSEWLFDENRKAGDTMVYHDEEYTGYIAMMFERRVDPDYDYVNVRHALIVPEEAEDGSVSDEAWADAEAKANEIYNGYLAGEMTEEAFGELAKEYSSDGNAAQGGIYENVRKGQMVPTFNDWCFDETRTAGDTGIVKTPYGYHLMYFVGFGDNNLTATVKPLVVNEKFNAFVAECEVNYSAESTDEMENVGGMLDDIINSAKEVAGTTTHTPSETEKETKSYTGIIIGVLVAIILVCIVIIIKNGGKKKVEPIAEIEEYEESVLEATDEDLTEEELLAEETFEENSSEETEETEEEATEE